MNIRKVDLPRKTISQLISLFSAYPEIERVVIFGSRALGNAKAGSDVDLAFSGKNLSFHLVGKIQTYLEEETLLPYFFDCVHLGSTQNTALLEHIKNYGIDIYNSKIVR
jgi:predicted nucleotidyltransferase